MRFLRHLGTASATCLALCIQSACTSNICAFFTSRSTQVVAQDPNTAKILHSSCNSLDSPVFPIENPNVLPTLSHPRNGTALAAAGWWDEYKISASVFFQNEDGDITESFFECNLETGKFNRTGEWYPAFDAGVDSVHNETGLSAEFLGKQEGHRLFYHNKHRQVMMMSYKLDTGTWTDEGLVSRDKAGGMALASTHREKKHVSVAFPRGSEDIEVARLEEDDLRQLDSFPRPLNDGATNETAPSKVKFNEIATPQFYLSFWDPSTQAIGLAATKNGVREFYRIGTDLTLYFAHESDTGDGWTQGTDGALLNWTKADKGRGGLAVVSPSEASGEVWLYYWAGGTIVQAHKSAGHWEKPSPLPANAAEKNAADPPNKDEQQSENADTSGWSTAVKAGVGVGVSVGVLALGALTWFLVRRYLPVFHTDSKTQGTEAKDQSCDLPEVYIVQKATPIADQSRGSSEERNRPVEMEQPLEVHELVGDGESSSVRG